MSHISGTGSYGYGPPVHNPADDDELNQGARRALDGTLGPDPNRFETWSPAMVKEAFEGAQRADERTRTIKANADEFILRFPEFLDTPNNANLISATVKSLYGEDATYTVEQFAKAYDVLRASGAKLDIDQAEVAKQQQAAENAKRSASNKQRAAKAARQFNPNADYDSLSLEEIKARANEAILDEMQAAGERGGYDGR